MALPPGTERDTEVQRLGTYIESKIPGSQGQTIASQYEAYAAAHPNEAASEAYLAWFFSAVGKGLGESVAQILSLSAKNAEEIAKGTVSGLNKTGKKVTSVPGLTGVAAIGDFFSRLTEANTWLRVGEVVLGIILLGIGVARITGAQNAISSVVKARIP